ncbi:hypothetical protein [Fodinibius sp.]|uniref:hypothetical protein n=1 Tax=Fodinibius sp. TaxID=1872440 RepID=UPI002ACDCB68|nr:hypothetical protein [Fodinibius sp.]MDZ7660176.1 hypothetical protein [Fodinibius sp.]
MKNTQKISNNFLVYSTGIISILIYIFGIFAIVNVVKEASQVGVIEAILANVISTVLGIICLFLAMPSYKLTKSLKILEITDYENGTAFLCLYSPLFADDMPQADSKITIKKITEINQNSYFNRLVELRFEENGTERIIKSFISPKSIGRLKNT